MSDKVMKINNRQQRIFPGALTAEQREAKLQAEIAAFNAKQEQEKAKEAKEKEKENREFTTSFLTYRLGLDFNKKRGAKIIGSLIAINALGMGASAIIDDSKAGEPRFSDNIIEMYNPYYHGGVVKGAVYEPAFTNKEINDRWKGHMILLGIEAFILACIFGSKLKKQNKIRKSVDIMADVEKMAKEKNISKHTLLKMLKAAPEVIRHMSEQSATFFNLLMDGELDCAADPKMFELAKNILEGHLNSHPEDEAKVLAAFDVESLPTWLRPSKEAKTR